MKRRLGRKRKRRRERKRERTGRRSRNIVNIEKQSVDGKKWKFIKSDCIIDCMIPFLKVQRM